MARKQRKSWKEEGGGQRGWVHSFLAAESRKEGFRKLTCSHSSRGSAKTIQHSHAIKTTTLSVLLRFYFHGVLEQLKTNFQTNFRFKSVLGFVLEYAWISKLLRDEAFKRLKIKVTYFGVFCYLNSSCIRKSLTLMFISSPTNKFTLL